MKSRVAIKFSKDRPTEPGGYLMRCKNNFTRATEIKYVTLHPVCEGSDCLYVKGECAVSAYAGAEWCRLEVPE